MKRGTDTYDSEVQSKKIRVKREDSDLDEGVHYYADKSVLFKGIIM